MQCKYFGICGSCTLYEKSYDEQLKLKKDETIENFKEFGVENIDVIASNPSHFRCRAEFRIYHIEDDISYAMNRLDRQGVVTIDSCEIVHNTIYSVMPKIIDEIIDNKMLRFKLFSIEFLTSNLGEMLVTMIYHKKIDNSWDEEAKKLSDKLDIKLIGRSRKIRRVLSDDFITDEINVNGDKYRYQIYENSFIQPNCAVNAKMIGWVKSNLIGKKNDLLEAYCGHGNFTIALSSEFNRVLATEISKTSIKSAKINCMLNDIDNIEFIRLSAEELTEAINKKRVFTRLKDIDLDSYNFSHIFVDPPRSGLDEHSINLVKKFDNILYVSCSQETLKRDLKEFADEYKIINFAIFDQFAYTSHIETGVILRRVVDA
jgi:tRNA (uracil-5-)-methyltransferase